MSLLFKKKNFYIKKEIINNLSPTKYSLLVPVTKYTSKNIKTNLKPRWY